MYCLLSHQKSKGLVIQTDIQK
uniref:Uncharacterized protein n=1 Tax=Rhizophora mucronata TaxID=61149 RepID=A0A2P2MUW7_RHIMU